MALTQRGMRFAIIVAIATGSILGVPGVAHASSIVAEPVKLGLNDPTAFTFAPDGLIYYVERTTGQIRILNPATGTSKEFFTVPGAISMLGLALHPNYPTKPHVYVYGTRELAGVEYDQLLRITNHKGMGTGLKVLLSRRAAPPGAQQLHDGGRLLFGPDGFLYLVIGDEDDPSHSQDPSDISGKLLRMTAAGAPAPGNPVAKSRIFASGIRNSIGYDFDPQTGRLWLDDNGPECNDELDLISTGANYGWGPVETCGTPPAAPANTNQDGPSPVLPEFWLATPVGPTGLAFCDGCGLGTGSDGNLFFGDYNGGSIHEVTLDAERDDVVSESVVFTHTDGVLSLEVGPDGAVYFSDVAGIYRLVSS
jgi:glucose/arabinose dehydrogenase